MQLSVGNMGIVIDPGDPLGIHKVKAEITDKITFTATEAPKKE